MLSQERIQQLAESFVCAKVDPRESGVSHKAMELKSTRYVPEIVLIDKQGYVAESVQAGFDLETIATAMERVLQRAR